MHFSICQVEAFLGFESSCQKTLASLCSRLLLFFCLAPYVNLISYQTSKFSWNAADYFQILIAALPISFHRLPKAMSEQRASKLRRLNNFRRNLPHVSASALAAILQEAAAGNIPEIHHSRGMWEATAAEMNAPTPYGSLLASVSLAGKAGNVVNMMTVNPLALLYRAVKQGGSFTELVQSCMAKKIPTLDEPWSLLCYADEVVPGNALSSDNRRKVWVIYVSFLEFGPLVLQHEDAWLCVMVKRSCDIAKVAAGISQVFAATLKLFFGGMGFDISSAGVLLEMPDSSKLRLFCKLGMVLQDGGAQKHVWCTKGEAGTKLCMLCRNLMSVKSNLVDEDGENLLTCSIVFEEELDFATDSDIKGTVARLAADKDRVTAKLFQLREQAVGFKFEPHGLLWDAELAHILLPATQFCHDWMHAFFVTGIFHTVMTKLWFALADIGLNMHEQLYAYIGMWQQPKMFANSSLAEVFSKKRFESNKKAKCFKCTASEGLGLYSIIASFLVAVVLPSGRCNAEVKAFLAMADLLDLIQTTSLGKVSVESLKASVRAFLQLCLDAGWKEAMQPKFHWVVHLPGHLQKFGCLLSCFVHERKHKLVKRYSNDICNTISFEKSVLGEVCSHTLAKLSEPGLFSSDVCLLKPRKATPQIVSLLQEQLQVQLSDTDCFTGSTVRLGFLGSCSCKDVVLLKTDGRSVLEAGEVLLHMEAAGELFSLVSLWQPLGVDNARGSTDWKVVSDPTLVFTTDIAAAVTYSMCRPDVARILVPYSLKV
jgi:hypothetical protein